MKSPSAPAPARGSHPVTTPIRIDAPSFTRECDQIPPAAIRQADVRDEHLVHGLARFQERHRVLDTARSIDRMAVGLQQRLHELAAVGMILDQQNASRNPLREALAPAPRPAAAPTIAEKRGESSCPTPGVDSISAWPRCRFTMPYTSARPSPVPALPFVVKNGSKARSRTSADMPMPESRTSRRASLSLTCVRSAERSAAHHGVERVLHEVEQRFANLAGDAAHDRRRRFGETASRWIVPPRARSAQSGLVIATTSSQIDREVHRLLRARTAAAPGE